MARMVSTKAALSIRLDALADADSKSSLESATIGIDNRVKLEARLRQRASSPSLSRGILGSSPFSRLTLAFHSRGRHGLHQSAAARQAERWREAEEVRDAGQRRDVRDRRRLGPRARHARPDGGRARTRRGGRGRQDGGRGDGGGEEEAREAGAQGAEEEREGRGGGGEWRGRCGAGGGRRGVSEEGEEGEEGKEGEGELAIFNSGSRVRLGADSCRTPSPHRSALGRTSPSRRRRRSRRRTRRPPKLLFHILFKGPPTLLRLEALPTPVCTVHSSACRPSFVLLPLLPA